MRRLSLVAVALVLLLIGAVVGRTMLPPKGEHLTSAYTYDMYLQDHGKQPAKCPKEHSKRKAAFEATLADILAHNANAKRSYTKGVNRFSDWLPHELSGLRGSRREPKFQPKKAGVERPFTSDMTPPASSLDWRKAFPPVLTAVKDQGMCGDCWAHAVTETIESSYARKTGQLLVLSQQQITSCTPKEGSCWSCNGHYPRYAYEYASDAAAVLEEWIYPFTSYMGDNPQCLNMTEPQYPLVNYAQLMGYMQVAPNNQEDVIAALNQGGPLSILVDAEPWMSYESGVFDGCTYDKNFGLDHAVQLVGYGHDDTLNQDYWIVRNSWSAGWGEHGFIRLQKSATPQCGLNFGGMSCFTGANNTQPTPSCGMCGLLSDAQFAVISS